MPELISMKLTSSEKEVMNVSEGEPDSPEYPWGLSLNLNSETLKKLGYSPDDVGEQVVIVAKAFVKRTSQYKEEGEDEESNVCLQISDMAIEKPKSSDGEKASRMFPSMSTKS